MKKEKLPLHEQKASQKASEKQAQAQTSRLFELLVKEMKRFRLSPTYVEHVVLGVQNGYFKHVSDGRTHPKVCHLLTLLQLISQRHQWRIEQYRHTKPEQARHCMGQYEAWQRRLREALRMR